VTPQDLIAAFDTLAEAPDGMTRLRELVLQLAVRGKLVPQDPEDEPARVLLENVHQQRAALVKAKQIRKSRPQPPVPSETEPWVVPDTWAWTRFGTVTYSRLGKMLDKSKNTGQLRPYLRNANLQWFTFELDDLKELRLEDAQLEDCTVRVGDLVICEGGEPGRAAVCTLQADGMVYQKALHRARPLADICSWYLAYLLRCDTWSGRLAELFTGATIKHLTGRSLASYAIPIPPLAEQHRIIARVDELMGLLDRLAAARTARDTTRAAARDAALAALREADTPEEVEVAWDRFAERMDDLVREPDDIEPVRQAVLQLAVRGKLVPQDAGDEPASVLLERVAEQRAALVKAKQIRKSRPQPPVPGETEPWEVPDSWAWTRFGTVTDSRLGKMLDKSKNTGPLRPYLRNANLQWFTFELDDLKELRLEEAQLDDCTVRLGDLVICEGGEPGRAAVCTAQADGMVYQKALHRARPLADINSWYLAYLLRCDTWSGRLAELFTGATIKHLTGRSLASYAIPLPPLAEQHRIVARVDELMGLLDRLEARFVSAQGSHGAFASAAVHHLDS